MHCVLLLFTILTWAEAQACDIVKKNVCWSWVFLHCGWTATFSSSDICDASEKLWNCHSLIEVNIWVMVWVTNPESYILCVTLYPAALLFHTPKQLSLVASWLQLFHNKLCSLKQSVVYSQQTLRTSGFTSPALIQDTFLISLLS